MRYLKEFVLILLIGLILVIPFYYQNSKGHAEKYEDSSVLFSIKGDPLIFIDGNGGFTGYPGYGNITHPYIIEDKLIDGNGSNCIDIQNTDAHFIVQNCTLYDGFYGIRLYNVTNGIVTNNTIYTTTFGILLSTSINNVIDNNTIHSNLGTGIVLSGGFMNTLTNNTSYNNFNYGIWGVGVNNNTFIDNILYDNDYGFLLSGTNNCKLINNEVHDNNLAGIGLFSKSSNNTLIQNFVYNNTGHGIYLNLANHNNLTNNIAIDNWEAGFLLLNSCYNNTLFNNTANDNNEDGIFLWVSCGNNIISNNTANYNNFCGIRLYNNASDNTITNNSCNHNNANGIALALSSLNNTLKYNSLSYNPNGIRVINSNNNSISFNIANNNSQYGIQLDNSSFCNITWNIALGNLQGIIEVPICIGNLIENNNCYYPALTSPSVNPPIGEPLTSFNYTVNYTDADDDPPTFVRVLINGTAYETTKANILDDVYYDGCIYNYTIALPKGTYNYSFTASDGVTTITTGIFVGPLTNYEPILSNYYVSPPAGNTLTNFTFYANYTDADDDQPTLVRVLIDGIPYSMAKENVNDTTFTDGCIYVHTTKLSEGYHNFSIEASDGFIIVSTENSSEPYVNYNPTLTNYNISPLTGNPTTNISFLINYTDVENDAPIYVQVLINGVPFSMTKQNSSEVSYFDGCIYTHTTNLSKGSHNISFQTSDGFVVVQTQNYSGPLINWEPVLTEGKINLEVGDINTIFSYSVNYSDKDNEAPIFIHVRIDGIPFEMSKQNQSDNNYTDGCIYFYNTGLSIGNHTYSFKASDGFINISTGETPGPVVSAIDERRIPGFTVWFVLLSLLIYYIIKKRKYHQL